MRIPVLRKKSKSLLKWEMSKRKCSIKKKKYLIFNWRIIAFQNFVAFCQESVLSWQSLNRFQGTCEFLWNITKIICNFSGYRVCSSLTFLKKSLSWKRWLKWTALFTEKRQKFISGSMKQLSMKVADQYASQLPVCPPTHFYLSRALPWIADDCISQTHLRFGYQTHSAMRD